MSKNLIEGVPFKVSFNDLFLRLWVDLPESTMARLLKRVEVRNVGVRSIFTPGVRSVFTVSQLRHPHPLRNKTQGRCLRIEDGEYSEPWTIEPNRGSYQVTGVEVRGDKVVIFVDPAYILSNREHIEFPGSLRPHEVRQ